MKYWIFLCGISLVLSACFFPKKSDEIQKIKFRIINKTEFNFTNVSVFSKNIGKLASLDTIAYAVVHYNSLVQDPLFYGINNEVNYARYLVLPKKNNEKVTYCIDSINNNIIYISNE